ncbi:unnamed protein product, partial [Brassica rapa subsp. narinosa]
MLEEMFKADSDNIPDSWRTEAEEEEVIGPDSPLPPGFEEVQPRGYDHDFWDPLIAKHLGGSDAEQVFAGIDKPDPEDPTSHHHSFTHVYPNPMDTRTPQSVPSTTTPQRRYPHGQSATSSAGAQRQTNPHGQSNFTPSGVHKSTTPHVHPTLSPCTPTPRSNNHPPPPPQVPPSTLPSRETRPLSEISGEEFDVPPLFDDLSYEAEDVPDLNWEDSSKEPFVGKLYATKQDCQIGLAIYAIKERFYFRQTRTTRHSFVLGCHDTKCDWRILAKELTNCGYYTIKKAQLDHTCTIETRNLYRKKATSKVLAHIYRSRYTEPINGPKSLQLQQMILEDLRIDASNMKCHRTKEQAVDNTVRNAEDSFLNIASYFERLKATNAGTVTAIETEPDIEGNTRFLYGFLAFGASIQGFRRLRKVLIIDGTHLSWKYKGVLLTASGQDGNFQVFPLAFAVVDGETEHAWTWFLTKFERIIADSNSLTIISDRHLCLIKAKLAVFPKAHHGACIVHLMRNVISRFKNKGLAKMVCEAAFSYRRKDFDLNFTKIRQANGECTTYLEGIETSKWSRTYFQEDRYNFLTSNTAEQLNNALKKSRSSPIIELFMFIQRMLTTGSKIANINTWSYQVRGVFGHPNTVSLENKVCTCQVFQKLKIPCGHALLAADSIGLPYVQLFGDCYKTHTWIETYAGVIYPDAPIGDFPIPETITSVTMLPPQTRRPSGRPKDKR